MVVPTILGNPLYTTAYHECSFKAGVPHEWVLEMDEVPLASETCEKSLPGDPSTEHKGMIGVPNHRNETHSFS